MLESKLQDANQMPDAKFEIFLAKTGRRMPEWHH